MLRRLGRRYYYKVLGLFLAAALLPVVVLSLVLTGISKAALERAIDEGGRAAAINFAQRVTDIVDRADAALREILASDEARGILESPQPPSAESATALSRLLSAKAPRGGDFALALVGAAGDRAFSSRDVAPDWDPRSYGGWGVLRRARETAGGMALIARRRIAADGETEVLVAARSAPRGGALGDAGSEAAGPGAPIGFALAGISRSALVRAARPGVGPLASDAEVLDASSLIAFSLADPSREGRFADEAGPADEGAARAFEAATGPWAAAAAAATKVTAAAGPGAAKGPPGSRAATLLTRIFVPDELAEGFEDAMRAAILIGLGACALIAALLALAASRIVTDPVLALSASMRRIEGGDLAARVRTASDDEIGRLGASFNAMAERLDHLVRAAVEDGLLLRRAELDALAARMNPHFLYNTLGSIKSLAKLGLCAEVAETATRLGKLLRASIETGSGDSTLAASLEMVRHYVAIERVRFGERVSLLEEIDPRLAACPLPPLVLEPLAENAFTHGIELCAEAGRLRIEGRIEGYDALIAFEDDGPGCDEENLAELRTLLATGTASADGRRLGLANTNRRLLLRYGPGYGVAVGPRKDGRTGFRAELRVPLPREEPCSASS